MSTLELLLWSPDMLIAASLARVETKVALPPLIDTQRTPDGSPILAPSHMAS